MSREDVFDFQIAVSKNMLPEHSKKRMCFRISKKMLTRADTDWLIMVEEKVVGFCENTQIKDTSCTKT